MTGSIVAINLPLKVRGCRVSSMSTRVPSPSGVSWKTQPPPGPKTFDSCVVTMTLPFAASHS